MRKVPPALPVPGLTSDNFQSAKEAIGYNYPGNASTPGIASDHRGLMRLNRIKIEERSRRGE